VIDLSTAGIRLLLTFAIALPILPANVAQAQQTQTQTQQTIVGTWAIRSRCTAPLSTIVIEPLALSGEDFYCKFDKVTRNGDTVRWSGRCNFSENGYEPSTVTAQLRGRRLYYRFEGMGWNGPFDRCT
jgi:hypothetical protein